jgi:hypothetical protein
MCAPGYRRSDGAAALLIDLLLDLLQLLLLLLSGRR